MQYYKHILGEGLKYGSLDSTFWSPEDKLTSVEQDLLVQTFTKEEIRVALFDSSSTGAPGLDGFIFLFYQHFWNLVKYDVMTICSSFHSQSIDLAKLNRSISCLIPKEHDARVINKFRPISLTNCIFKLISKVLTSRLEVVMSRIIDESQSTFLKGMYILDNVVISQEIIHDTIQREISG